MREKLSAYRKVVFLKSWFPVLVLVSLLHLAGCNDSDLKTPPAGTSGGVPSELQNGESSFNRFCSGCHGHAASGSENGPTFIHKVYEPGHHGDESFFRAARMGVRAHHWKFGDMPKIEGVGDQDLEEIVAYIRWLQRQAGIH